MKTFGKRFLGLVITICMASVLLVSASAVEFSESGADTSWLTFVDANTAVVEEAIMEGNNDVAEPENAIDPHVIVYSGAFAGIKRITLYPAVYFPETGELRYNENIYRSQTFAEANNPWGALNLSPAATEAFFSEFKNKTGYEISGWVMQVQYNIYTDGAGSYGRYFEFTPPSTCINADENGKIHLDMRKNTQSHSVSFMLGFTLPDNTDELYDIGTGFGGFYYYDAKVNRNTDAMTYALVGFN